MKIWNSLKERNWIIFKKMEFDVRTYKSIESTEA